ncbi:hypothetical protein FOL46_004216 [Perkinsus olseni]|uniref:Uncharacterized protein n=1 Tax=Perkinsus olseni TaxID=32597 RepID=A0A7J6MTM4_PEROL|nr:hypothetical protein FOL46_004216 [Perkinsus olseni]
MDDSITIDINRPSASSQSRYVVAVCNPLNTTGERFEFITEGLKPLPDTDWTREDMKDFWHAYSAPPDGFHKFALVTKLLDYHGLGRKSRSEVHLSRLEGALRRAGLVVDSRNRVSAEAFNDISAHITERGGLHYWSSTPIQYSQLGMASSTTTGAAPAAAAFYYSCFEASERDGDVSRCLPNLDGMSKFNAECTSTTTTTTTSSSPLLRSLDRDSCVEAIASLIVDGSQRPEAVEVVRRCWSEQQMMWLFLHHREHYKKAMEILSSSELLSKEEFPTIRPYTRQLPAGVAAELSTLGRVDLVEIENIKELNPLPPGSIVRLLAPDGVDLGLGILNRSSSIPIRVLTRSTPPQQQASSSTMEEYITKLLRRRAHRAVARSLQLPSMSRDRCGRLIAAEADGLPGITCDLLRVAEDDGGGSILVFKYDTYGEEFPWDSIVREEVCDRVLDTKAVVVHKMNWRKERHGADGKVRLMDLSFLLAMSGNAFQCLPRNLDSHRLLRRTISVADIEFATTLERGSEGTLQCAYVIEGGTHFQLPLMDVPHRSMWPFDEADMRQRVLQSVKGRTVLDISCGYGGWGIRAAKEGAANEVVMLDESVKAVRYAEANAKINEVDDKVSTLLRNDIENELEAMAASRLSFDVVILHAYPEIKKRERVAFGQLGRELVASAEGLHKKVEAAAGVVAKGGLLVLHTPLVSRAEDKASEQMVVLALGTLKRTGAIEWSMSSVGPTSGFLLGHHEVLYSRTVAVRLS